MIKSKILMGFVLLVYMLSVFFQFSDNAVYGDYLKSFILPIVTLLYFLTVKRKSLFFLLFLVLYTVSDLLMFLKPYIPFTVDYYLGNSLYILAYSFLIIELCKSVCVFHVIRNFKIHMLVLTILNIYIIYVLQLIVDPYVAKTNEYYVEIIYNIVMLLLLSVALLNYFYKDNIKSLYLFIGALCIVFSEVIWVAYTYISEKHLLNVLSTSLFVVAFYFFYKQSLLDYEESEEVNIVTN